MSVCREFGEILPMSRFSCQNIGKIFFYSPNSRQTDMQFLANWQEIACQFAENLARYCQCPGFHAKILARFSSIRQILGKLTFNFLPIGKKLHVSLPRI